MSKPRAVLIADIHYSLATLQLADQSMRLAIETAHSQRLPLIVAGDLHDTKGAMRGECVNAMLDTFRLANAHGVEVYIIPGNHCRINEKSKEHALTFLRDLVYLVESPTLVQELDLWLVPYESNAAELSRVLKCIPEGSTVIAHTGIQSAYMGHYTQDKSSLPKEEFAHLRTISGHYHKAQDIKCGRPRKGAVGLFSYIGNPYTLNYGEASDGPKGFQILNTDGSLTQVPTNLRKHISLERTVATLLDPIPDLQPNDLVKIKVTGKRSELNQVDKKAVGLQLIGHSNFTLDLCPEKSTEAKPKQKTVEISLDPLIDTLKDSDEHKAYLKSLWRALV